MTDGAFARIPFIHHDDFPTDPESSDVLDNYLACATSLLGDEVNVLRSALGTVVLRVLETRLLTDRRLRPLLQRKALPDTILERVRSDLTEITGSDPTTELVRYVADRLRGLSTRRIGRSPDENFSTLLRRDFVDRSVGQLRCRTCGYWFRKDDLDKPLEANADEISAARRTAKIDDRATELFESEIDLTEFHHPERLDDPLKPVGNRHGSWTHLSVDHRVPRFGGGDDDLDNLEFACAFCNIGKSIYRHPAETVATSIAGSLRVTQASMPRQIAVVSALRAANGRCRAPECDAGVDDAELTVVLAPSETPTWGAPWKLRVRCYACARPDLSRMRQEFAS